MISTRTLLRQILSRPDSLENLKLEIAFTGTRVVEIRFDPSKLSVVLAAEDTLKTKLE